MKQWEENDDLFYKELSGLSRFEKEIAEGVALRESLLRKVRSPAFTEGQQMMLNRMKRRVDEGYYDEDSHPVIASRDVLFLLYALM